MSDKEIINGLVNDIDSIHEVSLSSLKHLTSKYPYCHILKLLLVFKMKKMSIEIDDKFLINLGTTSSNELFTSWQLQSDNFELDFELDSELPHSDLVENKDVTQAKSPSELNNETNISLQNKDEEEYAKVTDYNKLSSIENSLKSFFNLGKNVPWFTTNSLPNLTEPIENPLPYNSEIDLELETIKNTLNYDNVTQLDNDINIDDKSDYIPTSEPAKQPTNQETTKPVKKPPLRYSKEQIVIHEDISNQDELINISLESKKFSKNTDEKFEELEERSTDGNTTIDSIFIHEKNIESLSPNSVKGEFIKSDIHQRRLETLESNDSNLIENKESNFTSMEANPEINMDDETQSEKFIHNNDAKIEDSIETKPLETNPPNVISSDSMSNKNSERIENIEEEPISEYARWLLTIQNQNSNKQSSRKNKTHKKKKKKIEKSKKKDKDKKNNSMVNASPNILNKKANKAPKKTSKNDNKEKDKKSLDTIINSATIRKKGIVSETLAKLMIDQGKYAEAKEIYKELMVLNPEKRSYFANQLNKLS